MATLKELAVGYRAAQDALRHRIIEVEELPAFGVEEVRQKTERLRLLKAMRRDTREMAVLCERYYQRGYRPNERYVM